ncbi:MAG: hypothetical protein KAR39_11700 [Thermoplasmata archaeon]|nr:hypothetical protein [Thermoplasmata archaeon]
MYNFLEAWSGSIPAVQGTQVVQLLTDMRDKGIIKTEQDYRDALNRLTGAINATDPVPLSKLFPALLDQYIDSESFNWMIDKITSDLVSGFTEAQTIEDILVAHQKIYEEYTLAKLKQVIGIVEEKIALYSLLKQNQEGFVNMQYNTFTQVARSTNRSSPLAAQLFFDRSSRKAIDNEFDAVIDAVNEALELPSTVNTLLFVGAEEVLDTTTETDLEYYLEGNNINNVIDGTRNTFYLKAFLLDELTAGAQLTMALDCGALRPLNYIELYPVSDYPFKVTAIEYKAEDGITYSVELQEADLLDTEMYRPTRFHFTEITARELYVTVLQEHYTLYSYNGSSVKEQPQENLEGTYLESQAVQDIVNDAIDDDALLAHLQDLFAEADSAVRVYQYLVGFDNIWTGRISYEDTGIFVGEVFTVSRCRRVGLSAIEEDTTFILPNQQSTIEYWMYKQDYNAAGGLIGITALPILHEGESEAYERIHLTERTGGSSVANTTTLRFQGHWGAPDPTTVSVYLNGIPLELGVDWTFTDSGDLGLVNYTRVTITDPQGGEVYTVRYTPVQFLPGADTSKHYQPNQPYAYYFGESNVIRTDGQIGSEDVEESDLYLIIVIRHNNNIDHSQSPRVNEYSLLVASQDPNKLYE